MNSTIEQSLEQAIFVEQSAWMAFMNPEDPHYLQARSMFYELHDLERLFATTNYVVFETHQWLRNHFDYNVAQQFLETIDAAVQQGTLSIIPGGPELEQDARRMLSEYPDCRFSLNEALTSVVLMHNRIRRLFSFNTHYTYLTRIDRNMKVLPSIW